MKKAKRAMACIAGGGEDCGFVSLNTFITNYQLQGKNLNDLYAHTPK